MGDDERYISAGTLAETMIVARRRDVFDELQQLIRWTRPVVDSVDEAVARKIGEIYARFGKGFHLASLNYADCFAYELAQRKGCPLLFVGNVFSRTVIESAL